MLSFVRRWITLVAWAVKQEIKGVPEAAAQGRGCERVRMTAERFTLYFLRDEAMGLVIGDEMVQAPARLKGNW